MGKSTSEEWYRELPGGARQCMNQAELPPEQLPEQFPAVWMTETGKSVDADGCPPLSGRGYTCVAAQKSWLPEGRAAACSGRKETHVSGRGHGQP